jgi:demethylmenaquinone methyltransferase/2-methoxy-6-polyprenyl-1,4-benzoquinol methylase
MLEVGRDKLKKANIHNIHLEKGDSENLRFDNNAFDAATAAFGVRNFENLEKGLAEMYRVIRPGGKLVILEFSNPRSFPFKQLYNIYGTVFLPLWGRIFAGDRHAYTYLPESVKRFPDGENFLDVLKNIGFKDTNQRRLTFGICSIYTAIK